MKKVLLKDSAKASLTTFNEARKKFGLPPIYNIVDLVRGDITLLPDLPELSGLPEEELNPGYFYTAPVFARMSGSIPKEVKEVFSRKGTNVFCSLGSSGFPETLKLIVKALRANPDLNIVCTTTTILDPEELGENNERFYACRFLPAHLVNEIADIAVTHGGQGTVQTAIWAGTPVVGIGFQAEQQANIDGMVRAGMAIRVPLWAVNKKNILKSVDKVSKETYRQNAMKMQQRLRSTDGVKKSVQIMNNFLLSKYKD
jgi:UDP:flavonoid glycosyltransferase YjiC (YdhE family)